MKRCQLNLKKNGNKFNIWLEAVYEFRKNNSFNTEFLRNWANVTRHSEETLLNSGMYCQN